MGIILWFSWFMMQSEPPISSAPISTPNASGIVGSRRTCRKKNQAHADFRDSEDATGIAGPQVIAVWTTENEAAVSAATTQGR